MAEGTITPSRDVSISPTSEDLHGEVIAFVKTIKPSWKDKTLQIKLFTDGLSNKLIGCYYGNRMCNETGVLVRIDGVGTENIIDRKNEIQTFNLLSSIKSLHSAKLYATFRNGICYEFQNGDTLDENSVSNLHISKLIAQHLAKMHFLCQQYATSPKTSAYVIQTAKFFTNFPTHFDDPVKQKVFECLPKKSDIQSEMQNITTSLSKLELQMVLCHNDLLFANIIYDKSIEQIKFIDFEYSGFDFNCYDIGNHFAEYAGTKNIDYARYPSKEYQLVWLRNYLEQMYVLQGKDPNDITVEELNTLYVGVNLSALAAHLCWGTWSVYQACNSVIEFDFIGYAKVRFDEFSAKRDQFYSLLD